MNEWEEGKIKEEKHRWLEREIMRKVNNNGEFGKKIEFNGKVRIRSRDISIKNVF